MKRKIFILILAMIAAFACVFGITACNDAVDGGNPDNKTGQGESGNKHEHNFVRHEGQAPTCTETGWKAYDTCSDCDYTTYEEIAATGHNYVDYVCIVCKTLDPDAPATEGLEYSSDIGGYTVTGKGTATSTIIKIPAVHNDLPVTSIGAMAFWYCSSLESVIIPDSVTSIGAMAFEHCPSLTSLTIPDSVTSIGAMAFCECTSLESITISDNVTSISDSAFNGCSSLESIIIPDSVTSIGNCAFEDCSSLTSITISDNVTSIGWKAFYGCTSLISITIPDGVTFFGFSTFEGCMSLESIIIPSSVTSIGNSAFRDCTSLKSITIPDSVNSIYYAAFRGCFSLTIYCEATSKPSGWDSNWNYSDCPVVWGYKPEN